MSPDPLASGRVRPAAVVNEDIRALWPRAGTQLTAEERAEYERLLEEWAAAVRAEVVEAA
ncbi:hypothetical protein ACFXC8_00540 [Streptomyces sp. NPDC059441]|uniref:hypothetical protein n=1 Tax=Streptomyces sp. NPDC059441 TaxID=3346829 RepID=UPI0036C85463